MTATPLHDIPSIQTYQWLVNDGYRVLHAFPDEGGHAPCHAMRQVTHAMRGRLDMRNTTQLMTRRHTDYYTFFIGQEEVNSLYYPCPQCVDITNSTPNIPPSTPDHPTQQP